ncbi:metal ABC transporter solute-binding protein, Zn/Mn family [Rhizobium sp.]|jgi:zinc/manganese transport system substrate-binding protein|uniref:metal ABC transporter solute-binding protein, Zn/Mn family n=1 Tax=Rhizobium sp. TaxID=391 RepID=UPI000E86CF2C|nr:ABC transporter substrate-binding protein [Rhizobium sp.]
MKLKMLMSVALPLLMAASALPAHAETLKVVASFTVLADVVSNVGGDHVSVSSLVGPNGDPHEFEPSPTDAKKLKAADIAFVSGEGLEGWMDRLISASGYKGKPVTVSEGINTRTMEEDGKTVTDPHVWNSPLNVKIWVANIEKALAAADPADAKVFEANAKAYTAKLDTLNTYAHTKLDPIPESERKILTSHDAFGYLGREYKVEFLSPLGLSTETEASAADVAKLIDQIKAEHIKIYFFENSNDPRLVKQIAKATGAKSGGELYVEALSKKNEPAPTYEKMFRYNIDQLAAAMKTSS